MDSMMCRQVAEACRLGILDTVRVLLDNGKIHDVNTANASGEYFLHHACMSGNLELVKYLVLMGADVKLTTNVGNTCLHMSGISPEILQFLVSRGLEINERNHKKQTCLMLHCGGGSPKETIECILSLGCDVNAVDSVCQNALFHVIRNCPRQADSLTIVQLLIDSGINVNWRDGSGKSVMHQLVQMSNAAVIIEYLHSRGTDIDSKSRDGDAPIHACIKQCPPHCCYSNVQCLLALGADYNITTEENETALLLAGQRLKSASRNVPDATANNSLMEPYVNIAIALLDKACNVNVRAANGSTATVEVVAAYYKCSPRAIHDEPQQKELRFQRLSLLYRLFQKLVDLRAHIDILNEKNKCVLDYLASHTVTDHPMRDYVREFCLPLTLKCLSASTLGRFFGPDIGFYLKHVIKPAEQEQIRLHAPINRSRLSC